MHPLMQALAAKAGPITVVQPPPDVEVNAAPSVPAPKKKRTRKPKEEAPTALAVQEEPQSKELDPQLSRIAANVTGPKLASAFASLRANMVGIGGEVGSFTVGFLADDDIPVDGLVYELKLEIRKVQ